MNNLVLITSIIKTPDTPLSYTSTRSIFTHDERFEQTKKTIQTIREKIANSKILIVECSELDNEQDEYFKKNCDYFLNLYENESFRNNIYSASKSLGEGTMTINAIEYIEKNNIEFENFFKITGRYWLSENFNYENFINTDIIVHNIYGDINNTATSLYKLNKINIHNFYEFLIQNMNLMHKCVSYEILFSMFLNLPKENKVIHLNKIGVNGYISCADKSIGFVDN
jgi:hypothetical protein